MLEQTISNMTRPQMTNSQVISFNSKWRQNLSIAKRRRRSHIHWRQHNGQTQSFGDRIKSIKESQGLNLIDWSNDAKVYLPYIFDAETLFQRNGVVKGFESILTFALTLAGMMSALETGSTAMMSGTLTAERLMVPDAIAITQTNTAATKLISMTLLKTSLQKQLPPWRRGSGRPLVKMCRCDVTRPSSPERHISELGL